MKTRIRTRLPPGATILLAPTKVNDFRANWSRYTGTFITDLTDFYGGVAPPTSVLFPASSVYRPDKGQALVYLGSIGDGNMDVRAGSEYSNMQRQLNFVDTFSWVVGVHQFKFGIDYRHLSPTSLGRHRIQFFPFWVRAAGGRHVGDSGSVRSYRPLFRDSE